MFTVSLTMISLYVKSASPSSPYVASTVLIVDRASCLRREAARASRASSRSLASRILRSSAVSPPSSSSSSTGVSVISVEHLGWQHPYWGCETITGTSAAASRSA
jgi:hypothetical protein